MATSSDQWRTAAACRTEDPDLFFPNGETGPNLVQAEEAKAVCRTCPVMEACLQWALSSGQQAGVWGGTTEKERKSLRRQRARAAARNRQAEEVAQVPACGTTKAYYQHLLAGEPIDAKCRAASDAYERAATENNPPAPAACGTRTGYQKHRRSGETACDACRHANADADRRLRNTGTTKQRITA